MRVAKVVVNWQRASDSRKKSARGLPKNYFARKCFDIEIINSGIIRMSLGGLESLHAKDKIIDFLK